MENNSKETLKKLRCKKSMIIRNLEYCFLNWNDTVLSKLKDQRIKELLGDFEKTVISIQEVQKTGL